MEKRKKSYMLELLTERKREREKSYSLLLHGSPSNSLVDEVTLRAESKAQKFNE